MSYYINPKDDVRNYRFARQLETPMVEVYAPSGKFRWAVCVAVAAIALAALMIGGVA